MQSGKIQSSAVLLVSPRDILKSLRPFTFTGVAGAVRFSNISRARVAAFLKTPGLTS